MQCGVLCKAGIILKIIFTYSSCQLIKFLDFVSAYSTYVHLSCSVMKFVRLYVICQGCEFHDEHCFTFCFFFFVFTLLTVYVGCKIQCKKSTCV